MWKDVRTQLFLLRSRGAFFLIVEGVAFVSVVGGDLACILNSFKGASDRPPVSQSLSASGWWVSRSEDKTFFTKLG